MHKLFVLIVVLIFFLPEYVTGQSDIEIHGFASTGYLKSENNNYLGNTKDGTFEFTEFGINFNSKMSDNIRIGLQLYSYDLGDIGNNNIKLDWAFLDYQFEEYLGIKVGKIKLPIGLYNEIQDYDLLYVPIFLPQSIYTKYLRETIISIQGVSAYGNIINNNAGNFRYDFFTGTPEIDTNGGMLKYVNTTDIVFEEATFNNFVGARLKWETPLQGLTIAGSIVDFKINFTGTASSGSLTSDEIIPVNMDFSDFLWTIGSIEYVKNDFKFCAEYSRMDMEVLVKTNDDIVIKDLSRKRDGFYAQLSYRINSWLEVGSYYSVLYQDADNKNGNNYMEGYEYYGWQKDLTLSFRFNITDFWSVKIEEHFINGTFLAEPDNMPTHSMAEISGDTPGCKEENWSILAVKTTFSF
jgi:hypothetical protein